MEGKWEIDDVLHLKHRFHQHPLTLVDINQSEEKVAANCQGCGQVVSGQCFSCANSDCNYHLHQKCAQLPFINNHPLHLKHRGYFFLGRRHAYPEYACTLCKEKSSAFLYVCGLCYFCLDINCALYLSNKVGENFFYQSKDEAHQLAFIFFENHKDKLIKIVPCSWCHEPLADSTYVSAECKFHLHKSCFDELPTQIDHPCHRTHPLMLEFDNKNRFCKICQEGDDYEQNLFYYHCVACNFDIHLQCIWPRPVIEDHKRYHIHHEHPFMLHWRRDSFTCDACGTNGNSASYVCCACHLQVHVNCASLPRTIKISRHDHPLSHKYFFNNKKEHDCQVCFEQVKTEYGNYQCLKADCNYVAHVECATLDPSLYDVIEDENLGEDMDCSSFRVIEQNKDGEATKIRHFLHDEDEHDLVLLVLDDQMKQHDSRCCDGCVVSLSISGSAEGSDRPFYYSCLKCDFVLHKGCAVLPKKKHHWYHRFLNTLQSDKNDIFDCNLCGHSCSGFYYQSGIRMKLCLRCAKTPSIIKSGQVHKHKVFFDHRCLEQCNACGRSIDEMGSFRCKDCNSSSFTLDFACVTLPPTIEHKSVCDQHLLQLITYGTEQEEYSESEQAYCNICEICETKRDPKHWYYHCAICDTSAHPNCVLGNYPFIKTSAPFWFSCDNHHRLSFARKKIYECPPQCSECAKHCQDLFLECAPCNYIRHYPYCP
ncbi:Zinc finger, PHD-type [Corchorus olitorius]|uniref:Zinc finger, PHD-type n=1 Tax=Corchorus olitorius TaxID=93759 RepID=A0A1R3HNG5_9ROSI|nr:Zinc finger, PHD-type [Corchorus olitorius]